MEDECFKKNPSLKLAQMLAATTAMKQEKQIYVPVSKMDKGKEKVLDGEHVSEHEPLRSRELQLRELVQSQIANNVVKAC